MDWDPEDYARHSSAQLAWANDQIARLDLAPDEAECSTFRIAWIEETIMDWDPEDYARHSGAQLAWARALIAKYRRFGEPSLPNPPSS